MFTAADIAERIGGEVLGDGSTILHGFSSAAEAREGDLTFAENDAYFQQAEKSRAAVIVVSTSVTESTKVLIRVKNPRVAFAKLLPLFHPVKLMPPGIHPTAVIAATAQIDPAAHIGPLCVVGENTRVGARSVLRSHNHVAEDCTIGEDTVLHPQVVVYARSVIHNRVILHSGTVIGSDGYGYVFDGDHHRKVLQVGNVILHNDVEIGANCTVDRAAMGSTVIGCGTKIDNLVQIAHNVVIGEHCLMMSQAGIAGSTKIGDYAILAGACSIAGHLKIGDKAVVAGKSGVMRNIPDGGKVLGIPARPDKETKRQWIAQEKLPEMVRQLRRLEAEVARLTAMTQVP